MKCAWEALMKILPVPVAQQANQADRNHLEEVRLRLGLQTELILDGKSRRLEHIADEDDLRSCIHSACRFSPWTASGIQQGYLTAPGGHRIGLCGGAVTAGGRMSGIREPRSLCIRVAKDLPGISAPCDCTGSILIIGSPGTGKTTFLRDLIRRRSASGEGSVSVVDERGELFPACFSPGPRTDVLTGCSKAQGIESVLRTMGPACIAVDEITADEDCLALRHAGWCGVSLFASAHAGSLDDLYRQERYRQVLPLFDRVVLLHQDKTWSTERMRTQCSNYSDPF